MEELLRQANIPETWWPFCKIENGVIYTPNTEVLYQNGLATEEQYQDWKQANKIDIYPTKTNQELQEEIENLKTQLETVHERLCTQQEMSSTVIAHVFGMEALKNE